MPIKLTPDAVIQPMRLSIQITVGRAQHTLHMDIEKAAFYREVGEAVTRNFYNELHAFLEKILVPVAPPPPPQPPPVLAVELSKEKT